MGVERHLAVESLVIAPDDVMALVVVSVLPLLAVARLRPSTRDAIATGLALATFVLAAMALILGKGYHVDAVTVPHVAAQELLAGHDPYSTFDLPAALAQFGMNPDLVTHYEDGTVVRSLNYPALNFLLVTPFIVANPDAFFDGIAQPMLGAFAPYGVGFVRLGLDGPFPLLPRAAYGLLSAVSFLGLIAILWRFWRRVPIGAVIFPFVPLYLAWRSLQNYFGSVPLLAMAGDDELIVGTAAERVEPSAVSAFAASTTPAPATSGASPRSSAL